MGVDYTAATPAHAQGRARDNRRKNAQLIQDDAARLDLRRKFHATLCALGIGALPDYRGALDRMVSQIVPGGQTAIGEAKKRMMATDSCSYDAALVRYGSLSKPCALSHRGKASHASVSPSSAYGGINSIA